MHDELGNHRVVVHRDLAAVLHTGIDSHAVQVRGVGCKHGFFRRLKAHQPARAGQKAAKRVFGVDAALHGPAIALHVFLRQRQLLTRSNPNHQLHQIQPGDAFRHRMLHLQAGVHFQKVKALVFADDKFHRTRALVLHGFGQQHGLLAHRLTRSVCDEGRRRFFNHLLVAALNGALALIEVNHMAVAVADQLDFDMARLFHKLFNEHAVVAKAAARFIAAGGKAFKRLFVVVRHPQTLAATARAGLDHHRVSNALRNFNRFFRRFNRVVHAGYAVDACRSRQLFRFNLVTHGRDGVVLGANKNDALFFNPL